MDSQLLSSIASEAAEATNVPVSEPAGRRAGMGCDYQNIRASKGKRGTELLQAGRSSGQYRTQGLHHLWCISLGEIGGGRCLSRRTSSQQRHLLRGRVSEPGGRWAVDTTKISAETKANKSKGKRGTELLQVGVRLYCADNQRQPHP